MLPDVRHLSKLVGPRTHGLERLPPVLLRVKECAAAFGSLAAGLVYKLTLDLDDGKLLPDEHHLCLLKGLRSSIHRALATSHTQAAPLSDPNLVKENLRLCESRVGE